MQFNNLSNQVYAGKITSILIIIIIKLNSFLQCNSLGKVKSILIHLLRIKTYRHPGMHSSSSSIRPNTPHLRPSSSSSTPLPHRHDLSPGSNLLWRPATSASVRVSPTDRVQSQRQNPVAEQQLKVIDKGKRAIIHSKGRLVGQWKSTALSSNFSDRFSEVVSADSI